MPAVYDQQLMSRAELQQVQELHATHGAFAALCSGGRVQVWGKADYGGDCSSVAEHLSGGVSRSERAKGCGGEDHFMESYHLRERLNSP
eukprot:Skav200614  [mRNA]  locus=scaffold2873:41688:43019:- [translate_table: standard]